MGPKILEIFLDPTLILILQVCMYLKESLETDINFLCGKLQVGLTEYIVCKLILQVYLNSCHSMYLAWGFYA